MGKLNHLNLTMAEAPSIALPESACVKEWYFLQSKSWAKMLLHDFLFINVQAAIQQWVSSYDSEPRPVNHDLFMIWIADSKSAIMVFNRNKGMLEDELLNRSCQRHAVNQGAVRVMSSAPATLSMRQGQSLAFFLRDVGNASDLGSLKGEQYAIV